MPLLVMDVLLGGVWKIVQREFCRHTKIERIFKFSRFYQLLLFVLKNRATSFQTVAGRPRIACPNFIHKFEKGHGPVNVSVWGCGCRSKQKQHECKCQHWHRRWLTTVLAVCGFVVEDNFLWLAHLPAIAVLGFISSLTVQTLRFGKPPNFRKWSKNHCSCCCCCYRSKGGG